MIQSRIALDIFPKANLTCRITQSNAHAILISRWYTCTQRLWIAFYIQVVTVPNYLIYLKAFTFIIYIKIVIVSHIYTSHWQLQALCSRESSRPSRPPPSEMLLVLGLWDSGRGNNSCSLFSCLNAFHFSKIHMGKGNNKGKF